MTRQLSDANRELLEWKLGRKMTPGLKITLTAENLGALLDACRTDEQAAILERQLDAMILVLRGQGTDDATAEAMREAAKAAKH